VQREGLHPSSSRAYFFYSRLNLFILFILFVVKIKIINLLIRILILGF
jgi:hypothetical protein